MVKKLFSGLTLLFMFCIQLNAQQENTQSNYVLPKFAEGYVMMKGGRTQQMLLNYNTVTEEMVFKRGETLLAIGKEELKEVEYVRIDDRTFVLVAGKFYELLYEGERSLYAEHKNIVIPPGNPAPYGGTSHVSSVDQYSGVSSTGSMYYKMYLPDGYKLKPSVSYFVKRGESFSRANSLNQLRRHYSDKREAFDKYTKENKVKFENILQMTQLAEFLDK